MERLFRRKKQKGETVKNKKKNRRKQRRKVILILLAVLVLGLVVIFGLFRVRKLVISGAAMKQKRIFRTALALFLLLALCIPASAAGFTGKLIAITFDDGPGAYTAALLDELAARDIYNNTRSTPASAWECRFSVLPVLL